MRYFIRSKGFRWVYFVFAFIDPEGVKMLMDYYARCERGAFARELLLDDKRPRQC
jgi:hypothetical protein